MSVVFNVIYNGSEGEVNTWYPVFCVGLPLMSWELFIEKFLPLLLTMASLESTFVNRNAAVHILAAAALISAEKNEFEKNIYHHYMQLCQDTDIVIKKVALNNLKFIIPKVKPSEVEKLFFGEVVEQLKDYNVWIRSIMFDLVLKFHKLFSSNCLEKQIVPFISKEFTKEWKDLDCWLLNNCGPIVNFLLSRELFIESLRPVISKYFKKIIYSKDPKLNEIAVRNLSPMIDMQLGFDDARYSKALAELAIGPIFQEQILGILSDVINVHFAHKKISLVRPIVSALMQNENHYFNAKLFNCLSKVMSRLLSKNDSANDKISIDENYQKQIFTWIKGLWNNSQSKLCARLLIETIPKCQDLFPVIDYTDYFLREISKLIKTGNNAEREIAADSFCLLYLNDYFSETRNTELGKLIDLAHSMSCFERQAYISFVGAAFNNFSIKLIMEKDIIKDFIELANDKISNTRIRFLKIAKKIGNKIIDKGMRQELLKNLEKLVKDTDKDVKKYAIEAFQLMKQPQKIDEEEEKLRQDREEALIIKEKEVYISNNNRKKKKNY